MSDWVQRHLSHERNLEAHTDALLIVAGLADALRDLLIVHTAKSDDVRKLHARGQRLLLEYKDGPQ